MEKDTKNTLIELHPSLASLPPSLHPSIHLSIPPSLHPSMGRSWPSSSMRRIWTRPPVPTELIISPTTTGSVQQEQESSPLTSKPQTTQAQHWPGSDRTTDNTGPGPTELQTTLAQVRQSYRQHWPRSNRTTDQTLIFTGGFVHCAVWDCTKYSAALQSVSLSSRLPTTDGDDRSLAHEGGGGARAHLLSPGRRGDAAESPSSVNTRRPRSYSAAEANWRCVENSSSVHRSVKGGSVWTGAGTGCGGRFTVVVSGKRQAPRFNLLRTTGHVTRDSS